MKLPFAPTLSALFASAVLYAAPTLAAEGQPAFKVDLAKGQQLATTCGACHTQDGSRGVATYPILQGQLPEYIAKQLADYKAGKRKNAVMTGMAATVLSEDDAKQIAAFYASKHAKPGYAKSKDTVLLGQQIYRGGIFAKQVPACAGCHGPTGAGIPAQYPRIGGQHEAYLEAQLNAFRSGERANSPQMMTIASRLSDREIKAVADYVTGLH
ncbi:MAG: cytochrome c4 [Burkholderiales bacterium]|nr:cytochrome c4 [Burkholderiales bacterium]MDE1925628.1 cytochrome c4 [Burkholderiales bacterium]MDE2157358.1 cytochrome c4 [Burkholderiales bacterium]MDE2504822.1 cytochrome c4 [Burkholderiales bacterium]